MSKSQDQRSIDHSVVNEKAFELPRLGEQEFLEVIRALIHDSNLGAGIDVSGASGSGKSCFSELFATECLRARIPVTMFDPHGDSADRVRNQLQLFPEKVKSRVLYIKLSDPSSIASFNPLAPPTSEGTSSFVHRCQMEIQIALVADCILAACGEAAIGFTSRPVLQKWVIRWLTILVRAGLTLPCATMLLDPNHPIYRQVLKLVGDDLAHFQMESLSKMRSADQEAEIGSARNRLLNLLRHPMVIATLSRTEPVLDFQELYDGDLSLIVNADCGDTLTSHTQNLLCNILLSLYLQVVFRTPITKRRRRFLIIDELPIFAQSCGPLLEKCCKEIRKFKTSMVLLHQGANGFAERSEDPFLSTILDMCSTKVFFRHSLDAEFFGKLVARAAGSKLTPKRYQVSPQQFQDGIKILDLVDKSEANVDSNSTGTSASVSEGYDEGDSVSECLREAVDKVTSTTNARTRSHKKSMDNGTSSSHSTSRSVGTTYKQTAVAKMVTQLVCTGVQYYSNEEIVQGAVDLVATLPIGEAIIYVDGKIKPHHAKVPLLTDPHAHATKFGTKKVKQWLEELYELPIYSSPDKLLQNHEELTRQLLDYLALQPARSSLNAKAKNLLASDANLPTEQPNDLGL